MNYTVIRDMPKLESPFVRENGKSLPVILNEYRWVFSNDCIAVDKLDGTNVSILVENGQVIRMFNRINQVRLFTFNSIRFYTGVANSIKRGYFIPGSDGQFFGELIGPKIQGNPYKLNDYIWMPFDYLKTRYYYKFWANFVEKNKGKTDKEIFEATSDLFKSLWSLYKRQILKDFKELNENTGFQDFAAEGIVFYHSDGRMCKLRRDMFDWFKGKKH